MSVLHYLFICWGCHVIEEYVCVWTQRLGSTVDFRKIFAQHGTLVILFYSRVTFTNVRQNSFSTYFSLVTVIGLRPTTNYRRLRLPWIFVSTSRPWAMAISCPSWPRLCPWRRPSCLLFRPSWLYHPSWLYRPSYLLYLRFLFSAWWFVVSAR